MTDLKTANEQLTEAIAALESAEHEADVREAEALRLRLMELDERIGARIKAKLEAHKAIALAWSEEVPTASGPAEWRARYEAVVERRAEFAASLADAWEKHHEEHTGQYALSGEEIPDPVLVNGVAEMQQADDAS